MKDFLLEYFFDFEQEHFTIENYLYFPHNTNTRCDKITKNTFHEIYIILTIVIYKKLGKVGQYMIGHGRRHRGTPLRPLFCQIVSPTHFDVILRHYYHLK